jgi:hypothetical protein
MFKEKHYSLRELSELWGYSVDTLSKIFSDDPDVLKLGSPERRFKRAYISLRIPESVAQRVYADLKKKKAA